MLLKFGDRLRGRRFRVRGDDGGRESPRLGFPDRVNVDASVGECLDGC